MSFHIIYKFTSMHPHFWTNDAHATALITKHYYMQYKGNITSDLFRLLKGFQKEMEQRVRIQKKIVDIQDKTICFMVETDYTCLEVVEPRDLDSSTWS